jgi:hypothetical protein
MSVHQFWATSEYTVIKKQIGTVKPGWAYYKEIENKLEEIVFIRHVSAHDHAICLTTESNLIQIKPAFTIITGLTETTAMLDERIVQKQVV